MAGDAKWRWTGANEAEDGSEPMITSLQARLTNLLWETDLRTMPLPARWGVWALRYLYAVLRDALSGDLTLRAMSLVYTTLMSLVPLLAFSFSVLKGLDVHRQMEPVLKNFLAPLGEQSAELTDRLLQFVDNLQGTLLGGFGLIFLLFTVISMVQKVESSLNFIWQVRQARSLARRVSEYLSFLLLGPLLMAIALGVIASVTNNEVVQRIADVEPLRTGFVVIAQLVPYLIIVVAFSLLYAIIPNTRVKGRAAVTGGLCGGVLWASSGVFFAWFVGQSTRVSAVYSSFAIVILALIWVYVNWLVLLLGAQISYYVQHPEHLRFGRRPPQLSNAARERLGLTLMFLVARDFVDPAKRWRVETLASYLGYQALALQPLVDSLRAAGILAETDDGRLVPARSLSSIRITDVYAALRGEEVPLPEEEPAGRLATDVARTVQEAADERLGEETLQSVIDGRSAKPA